jgi:hypothetical protein
MPHCSERCDASTEPNPSVVRVEENAKKIVSFYLKSVKGPSFFIRIFLLPSPTPPPLPTNVRNTQLRTK